MVVFLANRANIQLKRLHRRIKNRFQSENHFQSVRLRVAEPREPGPYRVEAQITPQSFLDDTAYPVSDARIEVGFEQPSHVNHEFYWFNWIEPDRQFLLGWHQDDDHPEHGNVHIQVNDSETAIEHEPATFVDKHPMAIVAMRLEQLPAAVGAVDWRNGTAVGLSW